MRDCGQGTNQHPGSVYSATESVSQGLLPLVMQAVALIVTTPSCLPASAASAAQLRPRHTAVLKWALTRSCRPKGRFPCPPLLNRRSLSFPITRRRSATDGNGHRVADHCAPAHPQVATVARWRVL